MVWQVREGQHQNVIRDDKTSSDKTSSSPSPSPGENGLIQDYFDS